MLSSAGAPFVAVRDTMSTVARSAYVTLREVSIVSGDVVRTKLKFLFRFALKPASVCANTKEELRLQDCDGLFSPEFGMKRVSTESERNARTSDT